MSKDRDLKKSSDAVSGMTPRTRLSPPLPTPPAALAKPAEILDTFPEAKDNGIAMKFAFLGAGQGGGRMANAFWTRGYRRVAVFNTTDSDFDGIEVPHKLSLDVGGAAKDAAFAAEAMKGREAEVHDLIVKAWGTDVDCAFICAGLGGGTGSGTIAKLVQHAKSAMQGHLVIRIGAIVSLPPVTEGQQVARNAVNAMQQLVELGVSPLIVIDNARINELYSPSISRLHSTANDIVADLLHLFNRLAARSCPGYERLMTFDAAEFAQLLDSGVVTMGATQINLDAVVHPADVSKQIRESMSKNVLATVDLARGRVAACVFVGSDAVCNKYGMEYFDAGFTQLERLVGTARPEEEDPTVIHRGLYSDSQETESRLECFTMIGGLIPPQQRLKELAVKAGLTSRPMPTRMASFLGLDDSSA